MKNGVGNQMRSVDVNMMIGAAVRNQVSSLIPLRDTSPKLRMNYKPLSFPSRLWLPMSPKTLLEITAAMVSDTDKDTIIRLSQFQED